MKVYAIKELCTGRILSMKSRGGAYFVRKGDAERKMINMTRGLYEVVEFELVEVPNDTVKEKGTVYCYKVNWKTKILFTRSKSWKPEEYKMYKLVEV